jgi:hypothetical protein
MPQGIVLHAVTPTPWVVISSDAFDVLIPRTPVERLCLIFRFKLGQLTDVVGVVD